MDERDPERDLDGGEGLVHRLRLGLQPRQAPPGFSSRLMARLPATSRADLPKKHALWPGAGRWAAAAVLLGAVGGGYWQHQQQERLAGEHARDQLMLALRMSAATLNDVQRKVAKDAKGDQE